MHVYIGKKISTRDRTCTQTHVCMPGYKPLVMQMDILIPAGQSLRAIKKKIQGFGTNTRCLLWCFACYSHLGPQSFVETRTIPCLSAGEGNGTVNFFRIRHGIHDEWRHAYNGPTCCGVSPFFSFLPVRCLFASWPVGFVPEARFAWANLSPLQALNTGCGPHHDVFWAVWADPSKIRSHVGFPLQVCMPKEIIHFGDPTGNMRVTNVWIPSSALRLDDMVYDWLV